MASEIRMDGAKNIAYIKIIGKVRAQEVLGAFDTAVSAENYRKGMGRLWDFSEIDLSSLDPDIIPKMTKHSLSFPEGIRATRIASLVQEKFDVDSTTFMTVTTNQNFCKSYGISSTSLEGFLYPFLIKVFLKNDFYFLKN